MSNLVEQYKQRPISYKELKVGMCLKITGTTLDPQQKHLPTGEIGEILEIENCNLYINDTHCRSHGKYIQLRAKDGVVFSSCDYSFSDLNGRPIVYE
jgi:hypothetical protein